MVARAVRYGPDRQVAVLLIQERMETLVIGWRQPKHAKQCAIASACVLETAMNQRRKIISRQLVGLERLVDDVQKFSPAINRSHSRSAAPEPRSRRRAEGTDS